MCKRVRKGAPWVTLEILAFSARESARFFFGCGGAAREGECWHVRTIGAEDDVDFSDTVEGKRDCGGPKASKAAEAAGNSRVRCGHLPLQP